MQRRSFLIAAGAGALAAMTGTTAAAEWNPRRPLNIIVPYNAGGGVDLYARAVANAAESRLPVPVVVVNKPGAGGLTGAIEASKARPDGNTVLLTSSGSFLLGSMFKEAAVNPFESFQTVAQVGNLKGAIVVPAASPFQTLADLVEAAKGGNLKWGHNGRGGVFQVAGQTFLNNQDLEATDVPFKGGAKSRAAILGSQVDFGILGIQQSRGFEAELRVLAIFADERDPLFPDVPTAAEQGFNIPVISSPIILFAPNGVDAEIVTGMEAAMADIAAAPEFSETVEAKGTVSAYLAGADAKANLMAMGETAKPVIDALKAASN
ncbi:tripartite tricarboxylate transporter substrate binding protein [uncultured Roseobacter sp.]|uniref:tripartite tricarboxylate transporter substrate binding protein n=1 Tax=uncultured Roseobacter sp. TaxID=114847 RepID=UPI0026168BF7|nr:tripartite tricarboxylate transporter substrate binding protein [uncultured Roseobacter sp.]